MSSNGELPRFIIIGAAKAATTWIQAQLQANSAIFMPDPEPHFFSREFERGESYYRTWFERAPATASAIGEKSADYLSDPLVPARIAAMVPDAKLIVQLRDPVERAYSDYKMYFRRGSVGGSPEKYLTSPDNDYPRFLLDGLYGQHIERWLEHFPREQILVFRFKDVRSNPHDVVERVSRHIGVAPVFDEEAAKKRENDSKAHLLPLPVRKLLAPLKDSAKPLRGHPWFEGARSLLAREVAYPPLSGDLRRHLEEFYREDIALAEKLLDLDLSDWRGEGPANDKAQAA